MRLQFDDEDSTRDKENVDNTPTALDSMKPIKTLGLVDNIKNNPFLRPEATDSGDTAHEEICDQTDRDCDVILDKQEQETSSRAPPDKDARNPSPSLEAAEEASTNGADDIAIGSESEHMEKIEDTLTISSTHLNKESELPSEADEVPTNILSHAGTQSTNSEQGYEDTGSLATCIRENKSEPTTALSQQTDEEITAASESVYEGAHESSCSQRSQDCLSDRTQVLAAGNKEANETAQEISAAEEKEKNGTFSHAESEKEELRANLGIVIEGESKWSWQRRCNAMREVTRIISSVVSEEIHCIVAKVLPDLSRAINANLDELRPSIMSAALDLTDAIIRDRIDERGEFAAQVFPSVMDLGCGRSIISQEGSRSVALLLDMHPELRSILEDADNPSRLQELLEADEESKLVGEDVNRRAKKASAILRSTIGTGATGSPPPDDSNCVENKPVDQILAEKEDAPNHSTNAETVTPPLSIPTDAPSESPRFSSRSVNARFSQRLNAISGSPIVGDEFSVDRAARRSLHLPAGGIRSTPRLPFRLGSEGHPATPVVRNMKLGESVRKVSPGSRSKRIYTEEDMEEARRAAMRVVMEEAAQAHAKEREKLLAEKAALEKQVAKEKSDVADLKSVLEEFELTMQKMVSQGNTQASAYCAALEKETKKLKAELLEATEAYETIKERYDTGKQELKIYENKEARSIEQIRELKRNLSELQKWSNELKANTEKKLAKAFENVTSYRASYLEMEARLSKAKSDLDRVRTEHEKEVANHKETASALARVEKSLHSEQDARSSMEASLSATKATLSRMSVQKERLQRELSEAQDELKRVSSEVSKLRDADVRAKNASKQLESYAVERQSLKARAYDDMSRIRELENELDSKDTEFNELNAIAEEALSQLEKMKMRD